MSAPGPVALLAIGGAHWIAGVNYVMSLARALRTLPDSERPDILLVENPDGDIRFYEEIFPLTEVVRWSHRRSLRGIVDALKPRQYRKSPVTTMVEKLSRRGVSAVFPVKGRKMAVDGLPWIPWVVDFQHKYFPDFFTPQYIADREAVHVHLIQNAPRVVLSSRTALEDCDAAYPGYRDKLRILRFRSVPTPDWFEGDPAHTVRRYGLPEKFLISPNQFFVHKNHRTLFEAMTIVRDHGKDVHLVCTGQPQDFRDPGHFPRLQQLIRDRGMEPRIHILGLIPRLDQIRLIRAALAVVQPSLFEGISMVVEDAHALGKRVFLSDLPVHRDQDAPGRTYFDPHRPEALADAIVKAWDELAALPSPEREHDVRTRHRELVRQYARDFLEIAGH